MMIRIYHDDPHCKYTLTLPSEVQQVVFKRRSLPEVELQEGSLHVRRSLALIDVKKAAERRMFFTMKLNLAKVDQLHCLLGPSSKRLGEIADATEVVAQSTLGLIPRLTDLMSDDEPAPLAEPHGDEDFVVASLLHEQPSRFHRTHVEEEVSLSGVWLIHLHKVMKVDADRRQIVVSARPFVAGPGSCESFPLALHFSQLSFSELCALRVWEVGEELGRVFDSDFLSTVAEELREPMEAALSLLLRSPHGLAVSSDLGSKVVEALDILCGSTFLSGPPWKLTDAGHAHLVHSLVLKNDRKLLSLPAGQLLEASGFQLVLVLEEAGWRHEVVGEQKHKQFKKEKYTHRPGDCVWYTLDGCSQVSFYYLLSLAHLDGVRAGKSSSIPDLVLQEVPYGSSDSAYRKLLGLEESNQERQFSKRKMKFRHICDDDSWFDQNEKAKTNKLKVRSKRRKVFSRSQDPEDCDSDQESQVSSVSFGNVHTNQTESGPEGDAGSPAARSSSESNSSTTSTSSSSSSSTSSQSDSDSGPGDEPAGPDAAPSDPPPLPPPPVPPDSEDCEPKNRRLDRSFFWGDHLITPVGPDGAPPQHYQIKCGYCAHNIERACTKKRSVNFGGPDVVLLCLKYWASLGSQCSDQKTHLEMWNSVVLPAFRDNTLPAVETLNHDVA